MFVFLGSCHSVFNVSFDVQLLLALSILLDIFTVTSEGIYK